MSSPSTRSFRWDHPGTPLSDKIEDALAKINSALVKRDAGDRQGALGDLEGAVGDLEAAVTAHSSFAAQGLELVTRIVAVARLMATESIQDAEATAGDPVTIDQAKAALAEGDM